MKSPEIVDYYDTQGHVVGQIARREAEEQNLITANAIVFVFNSLGRVWLQKRPEHKKHYPGRWDVSACGGLHQGEKPIAAAYREMREEIGLDCQLRFARRFLNRFFDETGGVLRCRLSYLYVGTTDEMPVAQPGEADEVRDFTVEQVLAESASTPELFIPSMHRELQVAQAAYDKLLAS